MRRINAVLFSLLMIVSSLAGCIGGDDSAVTELEDEITDKDEQIAGLEALVESLEAQHQQAVSDLTSVQSTLQTTQTSLESAEANSSMHLAEIGTLQSERDSANSQISMLYELMSNMSDESNETFENMTSQLAELNLQMSNLSMMLNESYARHQENVTLVGQLTVERDSLQAALNQANNTIAVYEQTIADYEQDAVDAQELAALQAHVLGIIGADALDPKTNGDPQIMITNNGLSTQFNYTSNITEQHRIYVEFCGDSYFDYQDERFETATGLTWTDGYYDGAENTAFRYPGILNGLFGFDRCYVLKTDLSENQFNTTFSYPQLGILESDTEDLYISVCKQYECNLDDDWYEPAGGFQTDQIRPHYLMGGNVIPVTIDGEIPCTLGFTTANGNSCEPPSCTDALSNAGSGAYVMDCESVIIGEAYGASTNHTILNATTIFHLQGYGGTSDIFVCDASATAYFDTGYDGTVDVYILGLGTSDERHISWTSGSSNTGSLTTSSGGTFTWGDPLGYQSDISFLDWTDPDGVC